MTQPNGNVWNKTGLALVLALSIAGCGVKSQPTAPEGGTYPRQYPTALPALETVPEEKKGQQVPGYNPDNFYQYPNQPPKQ